MKPFPLNGVRFRFGMKPFEVGESCDNLIFGSTVKYFGLIKILIVEKKLYSKIELIQGVDYGHSGSSPWA